MLHCTGFFYELIEGECFLAIVEAWKIACMLIADENYVKAAVTYRGCGFRGYQRTTS